MQILSLASDPPQGTIYCQQGTKRRVLQSEQPRQQPQGPAPKYGPRKLRSHGNQQPMLPMQMQPEYIKNHIAISSNIQCQEK